MIPVLNFFMPIVILRELQKYYVDNRSAFALIIVWVVFGILGAFAGEVVHDLQPENSLNDIRVATTVLEYVFQIISTSGFLVLVYEISRAQGKSHIV